MSKILSYFIFLSIVFAGLLSISGAAKGKSFASSAIESLEFMQDSTTRRKCKIDKKVSPAKKEKEKEKERKSRPSRNYKHQVPLKR